MNQLFLLLYKYRASIVFVFLELICIWIIVRQNIFLGTSFFNSSNYATAKVLTWSNSLKDYFALEEVNDSLSKENAYLRKKIRTYQQSLYRLENRMHKDHDIIGQYEFINAKIVNNSIYNVHNYITINIGKKQKVEMGFGVVSQHGVVGKIATVSDNYAVISSLLNADVMISSKIKRTGHLGTTNWNGRDIQTANLLYIPRHVTPVVGDTVISSGYNAVFPEGIVIGTIHNIDLADEVKFYEIEIVLANDYSKLSYVYVIKNNLKKELQATEKSVIETHD